MHEPPDETEIHAAQREMYQVKNRYLKEKFDEVKDSVSGNTLRAVDLATQKGASSWLTVLPIRDMNFDLNKSEFRDAVKLRYHWDIFFSKTGGMAAECKRYRSRLAELLATKKGASYATIMSWIRARVSFPLLRSALLCLRGSRAKRRIHLELPDIDFDKDRGHANIR